MHMYAITLTDGREYLDIIAEDEDAARAKVALWTNSKGVIDTVKRIY